MGFTINPNIIIIYTPEYIYIYILTITTGGLSIYNSTKRNGKSIYFFYLIIKKKLSISFKLIRKYEDMLINGGWQMMLKTFLFLFLSFLKYHFRILL